VLNNQIPTLVSCWLLRPEGTEMRSVLSGAVF
jgi:hypothetical protein